MVLGFVESFLRQRGIGRLVTGLGVRQPAVCLFVEWYISIAIVNAPFLLDAISSLHLSNKLFRRFSFSPWVCLPLRIKLSCFYRVNINWFKFNQSTLV